MARVKVFVRSGKLQRWALNESFTIEQAALEFGGGYMKGCVNASASAISRVLARQLID